VHVQDTAGAWNIRSPVSLDISREASRWEGIVREGVDADQKKKPKKGRKVRQPLKGRFIPMKDRGGPISFKRPKLSEIKIEPGELTPVTQLSASYSDVYATLIGAARNAGRDKNTKVANRFASAARTIRQSATKAKRSMGAKITKLSGNAIRWIQSALRQPGNYLSSSASSLGKRGLRAISSMTKALSEVVERAQKTTENAVLIGAAVFGGALALLALGGGIYLASKA